MCIYAAFNVLPALHPTLSAMAESAKTTNELFGNSLSIAPPQIKMRDEEELLDYARLNNVRSVKLKRGFEVNWNGKQHVPRKPWSIAHGESGADIMHVEESEKRWFFNDFQDFSMDLKHQDTNIPDIRCRRQVDTSCYLPHRPEMTITREAAVLAYVHDPMSVMKPTFKIFDAQRKKMLTMRMDFATRVGVGKLRLSRQRKYEIKNAQGAVVSSLTKKRDGYETRFEAKCTLKQKEVILAFYLYLVVFYVPDA